MHHEAGATYLHVEQEERSLDGLEFINDPGAFPTSRSFTVAVPGPKGKLRTMDRFNISLGRSIALIFADDTPRVSLNLLIDQPEEPANGQ